MADTRSTSLKWFMGALILAILLCLAFVLVVRPAQQIKQLESIPGVGVSTSSHLPQWVPDRVRDHLFRYVDEVTADVTEPLPPLNRHLKLQHVEIWSKTAQHIDLRRCTELEYANIHVSAEGSSVNLQGLPLLEEAFVHMPEPLTIDARNCPNLKSLQVHGSILFDGCDELEHLEYTPRPQPAVEDWSRFTKLRILTIRGDTDGEFVPSFPPLAKPGQLKQLHIEGIPASKVPWSALTDLETLNLGKNTPGEADLHPCSKLRKVYLDQPEENTLVLLPASVEKVHLSVWDGVDFDPGRHFRFESPCREFNVFNGRILDLPENLLSGMETFGAYHGCKISDEVWGKLATAPKLEQLELNVGAEEFPPLDGFPALREFTVVSGMTSVTVKHAPSLERIYYDMVPGTVRTFQDVTQQPEGPPILGPKRKPF